MAKSGKIDFSKLLIKNAGVAGGAVGATFAANKLIPETVPGWMVGLGLVVLGNAAPLMSKEKEGLLHDVGNGVVAAGAIKLVNALTGGAISGIDDVMSGAVGDGEVVTIDEDFESVNGVDDVMSGADEDGDVVGDAEEDSEGTDGY